MSSIAGARSWRWSGVGLGLILGLALAWAFGLGRSPASWAQGSPGLSAADGSGLISFTSTTADGSQLLYLLDSRAQAFAIYKVDPSDRKGVVELKAARQYRWDLKLAEFNNQAPEVAAIEAMVNGSAPTRK